MDADERLAFMRVDTKRGEKLRTAREDRNTIVAVERMR
jgi:hypothetical protein